MNFQLWCPEQKFLQEKPKKTDIEVAKTRKIMLSSYEITVEPMGGILQIFNSCGNREFYTEN